MRVRSAPRRRVRRFVVVASAALLAALVAPTTATAAGPAYDLTQLDGCGQGGYTATRTAGGWTVDDVAFGYSYDQSFMTEGNWRTVTSTDTVYQLHGYGLMWLPGLLREARDSGDTSVIEPLVVSLAASLAWRPDNRVVTDPVWSEGVTMRRENSLNCLYTVTHDPRLVPLITALVTANLDPARYYGPPRTKPHNHGLLANLSLLDTAALLGRSDWRDAAIARMAAAIDGSFTPVGLSIEQSLAYHVSNVLVWSDAAARVRALGHEALATHIDTVLVRARSATEYARNPAGVPVNFGDQEALPAPVVAQRRLVMIDPYVGVLTGRWSWKAPDDFYAVRFGGPTRMHGHQDRGSVVWWATGRPVLVDPGTADYTAGDASAWSRSNIAHNVARIASRTFVPAAVISRTSSSQTSSLASVLLTGAPYGLTQTRSITVDPVRNSLRLVDTGVSGRMNQVLQLDPRWTLQSINSTRTMATFTDSTGGWMTVSTRARIASVVTGADGLAGGWTFRYPPSEKFAAPRVTIAGLSRTTVTQVRVYGPAQTPWASVPSAPAAARAQAESTPLD
ncbi:MAG TPA: heparinase II/III family protein [Candidatus Nanopelagicales bacterium]|nr:heparinase II/III family protein [Candidatus Nanopelagicales bacterium]